METDFWSGKRVLVTGHTGFKGAWLSTWLQDLGAQVTGFSLGLVSEPSLFAAASVEQLVDSVQGDVRDRAAVDAVVARCRPEVVFHLAAQALVRESYRDPLGTYATNVMGTGHLLEAVRQCPEARVVVVVTSDKCYENREWWWGYREIDPVGGFDPYSSSKGCAELLASAWRRSFFDPATGGHRAAIATARAGNVIGGGDWAPDRLVPDCVRALQSGAELVIRYPDSVRPWQFVLEPLSGYLRLAELCWQHGHELAEAWNFGPLSDGVRSVRWLVERFAALIDAPLRIRMDAAPNPHEARLLVLDCAKAAARLGWRPRLRADAALEWTAAWYRAFLDGQAMQPFTRGQIRAFSAVPQAGAAGTA